MQEIKKYQGIYSCAEMKSYGHANHGAKALRILEKWKPKSVLDVGCGWNEFCHSVKNKHSIQAIGVDFACPGADIIAAATELPFKEKEFEVLTSFDCLEHLMPNEVDHALSEFARVSEKFIFSISYRRSNDTWNGQGLHPTVRSEEWWMIRLMHAGATSIVKHGNYITGKWQPTLPMAPSDSVIVVGNGPSVLRKPRGELIDGFQHVIRFNRFVTAGFEQWVGRRTTLWSATPTAGKDGIRHPKALSVNEGGLPAECLANLHDIPNWYRIHITDSAHHAAKWSTGLRSEIVSNPRPSSGLLVMAYLTEVVGIELVHAVGFDHFAGTLDHYWHTQRGKGASVHDGAVEARLMRDLVKSGRVVLL